MSHQTCNRFVLSYIILMFRGGRYDYRGPHMIAMIFMIGTIGPGPNMIAMSKFVLESRDYDFWTNLVKANFH